MSRPKRVKFDDQSENERESNLVEVWNVSDPDSDAEDEEGEEDIHDSIASRTSSSSYENHR